MGGRAEPRPGAPPRVGAADLLTPVRVELESRAGAAAFRPWIFDHGVQLRRDTLLSVGPIAPFLRVGLDDISSRRLRGKAAT
jgi:hypothetical protein